MSPALRWGRWTVVATAVLLLFWLAAVIGGWAPALRRLATSVHGPLVADYRADSPARLAPLSPDVLRDAAGDQTPGSGSATPRPSPSGSATPSPTASSPLPTPSPSIPGPTLPVPTLPVPTPTLPVPTPTPLVTPSLPTPPPLP